MAAPDDVGDEAGPAGLVRGPEPGAVVAVEVLGESDVVPPPRVVLEALHPPKQGLRPSGPTRKIETIRCHRSWAMASSGRRCPDPVGYSTVWSSPKKRW